MTRPIRILVLTLSLAALLATSACTSMNSHTTGRALGKNRWEFTVGLSFAPNFAEGGADLDLPGLPVLDLNARFGVADIADVGIRLNTMGWFAVDGKVEMEDANRFTVAAKTGFGFSIMNAVGGEGIFMWELALPFDVHIGAEAKVLAARLFNTGTDATITTIPKYALFFGTRGGSPRHFVGFELYGKIAADKPSHYVTPFASMLFDVTGDEAAEISRVISMMGNFGVSYTYNDDY